jgi:acetoin utilization deacetylase AcuC-like enzyme
VFVVTVSLITHPVCLEHEAEDYHPEQPARLSAIQEELERTGLGARLQRHEAQPASREQLERVHSAAHVAEVFARAPDRGVAYMDPDTFMNPHSLEAALKAAGAVVQGVDQVMSGEATAVFCAVRPPGHHAERHRAMGFCLFNNVAVGAAHALAEHGLERVAIVDFDVHHGNGTEDIFRDEPRLLLCSSFQHPFYPGTGSTTVSDHIRNMPLTAGTDGEQYRQRVTAEWLPALDEYRPQLIFFSAGFDAHRDDPLGGLKFDESDFAWITGEVKQIAERHAEGRMVSTLEGGYNLEALGKSVAAHIEALAD